ncbi:hypothetical protein HOLleu_39244 [Holothuria leucospilota]|uniref:Uncharacterized protein n=1 Tax=Holothuria leucospilota TaxID=206669 RepID=A0A9Q0YH12_HOLLE|nr:hypothetical protein HOLleu_39244 [Holothuria leucospilota]
MYLAFISSNFEFSKEAKKILHGAAPASLLPWPRSWTSLDGLTGCDESRSKVGFIVQGRYAPQGGLTPYDRPARWIDPRDGSTSEMDRPRKVDYFANVNARIHNSQILTFNLPFLENNAL